MLLTVVRVDYTPGFSKLIEDVSDSIERVKEFCKMLRGESDTCPQYLALNAAFVTMSGESPCTKPKPHTRQRFCKQVLGEIQFRNAEEMVGNILRVNNRGHTFTSVAAGIKCHAQFYRLNPIASN
jgi:hypothetical protein